MDTKNVLNSPYFYGFLAMFLGLYGPRLSPKLPKSVTDLFENKVFRFVFLLLIVYMSNNNLQMALIITIAFLLLTSYSENQKVEEFFEDKHKENFSDFDAITEFYNEEFDNEEHFKNFEQPEEFDKMPPIPDDGEAFRTSEFKDKKQHDFASTMEKGTNIENFSSCGSNVVNENEQFGSCGNYEDEKFTGHESFTGGDGDEEFTGHESFTGGDGDEEFVGHESFTNGDGDEEFVGHESFSNYQNNSLLRQENYVNKAVKQYKFN